MMKYSSRVLLVSILTISFGTSNITSVFAQSGSQSAPADADAVVNRAEALYRQGEAEFGKGQLETARKLFDQAVDAVLQSGIDLRSNSRLDTYYRDLLERIHKHEAQPGDEHAEVNAPAVLDE